MKINASIKVSGEYKCLVSRKGKLRLETPWQSNMILDSGMDRLVELSSEQRYGRVGTSGSAVSAGQTTLGNQIAVQARYPSLGGEFRRYATGAPDYIFTSLFSYYFPYGSIEDTIREVGVGAIAPSGGNPQGSPLFSRIVLDDAIELTDEDQFTLLYRVTTQTTVTDTEFDVTLGGVDYHGIIRPASFSSTVWNGRPAWPQDWIQPLGSLPMQANKNYIVGITSAPDTSGDVSAHLSSAAYVPGSFEKEYTGTWEFDEANFVEGINSIVVTGDIFHWQIGFQPAINKTSDDELKITLKLTWSRA